MRRTAKRFLAAALLALSVSGVSHPVATADEVSRWERAAHAVASLWQRDADRSAKEVVRERFVRDSDLEHYGLTYDPRWERRAADKPLIVLLHGYNSTPERNGSLLRPLRKAGYPCAQFAFPNDHELVESAELLASELSELSQRHPSRRVALLTHSMGGLVARECIENPALDPGNVERLIMIAPPSQGTMVAHLAICADIWEHGLFRTRGGCITRLKDSIVDGLAEAADDLQPGSPFLVRLNRRPRNPNVEYTMFLGTGGKLREREVDAVRAALRKTVGKVPGFRTCVRNLDRRLAAMDEVIDGKGDGVVAVERALLPGVNDVVVLPFGHLSVTGEPKTRVVREVHQELLQRLE